MLSLEITWKYLKYMFLKYMFCGNFRWVYMLSPGFFFHLSRSNALVERVVPENFFCICICVCSFYFKLLFAFVHLNSYEKNLIWFTCRIGNKTIESCWMGKHTLLLAPENRSFIIHFGLEILLLSTALFNNKFGIFWLDLAFITEKDNLRSL